MSNEGGDKDSPLRKDIGFDGWLSRAQFPELVINKTGCDHELWYSEAQMREAYIAGAEAPVSSYTPAWIPMKERQPTDFQAVLCMNSAGYMATANRFSFGDGRWDGAYYTAEDAAPSIGEITHWMPLPDAPLPECAPTRVFSIRGLSPLKDADGQQMRVAAECTITSVNGKQLSEPVNVNEGDIIFIKGDQVFKELAAAAPVSANAPIGPRPVQGEPLTPEEEGTMQKCRSRVIDSLNSALTEQAIFYRHHIAERSSTAPTGYKLVKADVLAWLHGEQAHPLTGEWFERPEGAGAFWWRSRLRQATLEDFIEDKRGEVHAEAPRSAIAPISKA